MPIYFTLLIIHGGDYLHMSLPPQRLWPPRTWGLSLGKFKICDGLGFMLAQDIWAARICGFDIMILTETKITDQDYCCNRMGYNGV